MYKLVKLGDIAFVTTGFPFKGNLYEDEGIRVVRGENVTVGSLRWDSSKCWNLELDQFEKYALKEGDVVIGMDGSRVGKNRARIKSTDLPLLLAQRVACLRSNKKSNQDFLYYLIRSNRFEEFVNRIQTGSSIPHISQRQIEEFLVSFPPISIQEKIGRLLLTLDTKIELNNCINAKLESVAKSIYDYWFVQFDFPNAKGKPYKASGGKMVWNKFLNRQVPAGWQVAELRDFITSNRGVSYNSKDITGDGIPMINLNSFNIDSTYKAEGIKSFSGIYSAAKVLKPLDLVMCNTQQTALNPKKDIIGKSFLVPDIFDGDIVSSHHITTINLKTDTLKYYLNSLFNSEYFHRYISGYATGTNILGLNFEGVLSYQTAIPTSDLLSKYKSIIVNIEKQKSSAIKENQKLTELRDWLLPMLMNGQVKVGEGENELAMAAEPEVPYKRKRK